ncbi:dihydropteroate synthase [Bathymodiolus septemdierum thioautotrophic gill symbiont]|uniref:Dihydropteroate synthase n=1 Tax=endosymbiont of Bathymodiolus septemdierum str. Myojin knoll TaxID=1303921 RepID=A0A0P0USR0_9GAMM|nr:dihydropteroate synthase [Bathymodiolus septemdierum thioautotrophic gill symbiont]BAS68298.1 dihydropteroate synthase [endosymbiont of Bathymodiolus septemdierum str. Myojin knoll]
MAIQPKIMGILNVTPDSFSDGGQYFNVTNAVQRAQRMIEQGADIIDIGGESTRPGANSVSLEEEFNRVIPVIEALAKTTDIPISIDTSKPELMTQAVRAGASMINDVCALSMEGAVEAVAALDVDVCLMHMQGSPRSMQNNPKYFDVVADIKDFFTDRIKVCVDFGINKNRLILDPGFGFGKTYKHNLEILRRFNEFKSFGLPVLAGLSRKNMIGQMLNDASIESRMIGSVSGAIIAVQNGADIVRVHDVLETKDALTILNKVNNG